MTTYPINYVYDRHDGHRYEGFAATAEDAVKKTQLRRGGDWRVLSAELTTREVGMITRDRSDFEAEWADEIEAGWVSVIHVHGGYRGEATFWSVAETPIEEGTP